MKNLKGLGLLLAVLFLSGCVLFGPVGPEILYEENFNGDTEWYEGESDYSNWWVEGGKYHVLVKVEDKPIGTWRTDIGPFDNFQLDLDIEQVTGPDDNGYGIRFRMQDADNYYRFRISGDGWAKFDKRIGGVYTDIRPWSTTELINEGNETNHMTVIANGSTFTFYINGTELYSATDTSLTTGYIGFQVAMFVSPGQTHVAFDNLILTELE